MFQRRRRHVSGRARALGALGVFVVAAWTAGFGEYVGSIPRTSAIGAARVEAIVVLTGGGGRLEEGIALIEQRPGLKLFVTGVNRGVELRELLRQARAPAALECCVVLGYGAEDTRGNAAETAAWAAREGVRSFALVTSNYHMARSMIEFRRSMPALAIEPHPVATPGVDFNDWWRNPRVLRLAAGEYVKLLLALARPSFA